MSSKRYPEEFKIEAVKQVTERGHPDITYTRTHEGWLYLAGCSTSSRVRWRDGRCSRAWIRNWQSRRC